MKKVWVLSSIIVLLLFLVAGANATTISIVGGTSGTIPSGATNDLLGSGIPASGFYGSQLSLSEDSYVTFQFFGEEAGWNNYFQIDSDNNGNFETTLFTNNSTPWLTTSAPYLFEDGIIPFRFAAQTGTNGYATNGSNPNSTTHPNFFVSSFDTNFALGSDSLLTTVHNITYLEPGIYMWLDDGGAGPDDDHDDMLIKVSAAPVPEPATMLLVGSGLIGLAGFGRRKFSKK